jgi:predicted SAM-dependent methyltransferase
MMRRLNIGASRFERLPLKNIQLMSDSTWTHLGDASADWKEKLKAEWQNRHFHYCVQLLYRAVRPLYPKEQVESFYKGVDFRNFYYESGDRLDFEDNTFDFIYSEHFFEHLFLEEAFELLKECYRILKPNGVIRIIVPDADMRTYEKREPLANSAWTHPESHKTRWSVYSLPLALKTAELLPRPVMYCDKYGKFFDLPPSQTDPEYKQVEDQRFVFSRDYIQRLPSLVVDGIKI